MFGLVLKSPIIVFCVRDTPKYKRETGFFSDGDAKKIAAFLCTSVQCNKEEALKLDNIFSIFKELAHIKFVAASLEKMTRTSKDF
jgi:hypothetical protein